MCTIKRRYKTYFKLNILMLVFIVTSFIFSTFAWFAYSGLSSVSTKMDVKAWYIKLTKNGKPQSNEVLINLREIYPGMETISEVINIQNLGDSNAVINYQFENVRILENEYKSPSVDEQQTFSDNIEDELSQTYPFSINVSLERKYLPSKSDGDIVVSISWPLESGEDEIDSGWGTNAYNFYNEELKKAKADENYSIRPAIQIALKVNAEQDMNNDVDTIVNLGDTILYDIEANARCYNVGGTCIKTTVLDNDINKVEKISLLPNLYDEYPEGTFEEYTTLLNKIKTEWKVATTSLKAQKLMKVISNDIKNSYIVSDNISNKIIGTINNDARESMLFNESKLLGKHFIFSNTNFEYLNSNKCFWTDTEFDETQSYALSKIDETTSKIGPTDKKTTRCSILPIILIEKGKLKHDLNE